MKTPNKKDSLIYLCILISGIILGAQLPSLKTYLDNRVFEKGVLAQLDENPEDPSNWLLVSISKWRKGDQKGSLEAIQKALELNPNYVYAMETMGYNYMEIGKYKDAEKWFEKALKAAKSHAPGQIEKLTFLLECTKKGIGP